jgi:hypothetical protein
MLKTEVKVSVFCYNFIMKITVQNILPKTNNKYQGLEIAYYFLILTTIVNTLRSLVHMFAADGGAHSIAGINVAVDGGSNIIAIFGQWGSSQLLMAILCWVIIIRYKFFTPLAILLLLLEQLLRYGVGQLKPIISEHTPPGAISTKILIPVLILALVLSLISKNIKTS